MENLLANFMVFYGIMIERPADAQFQNLDGFQQPTLVQETIPYKPIPANRTRILARDPCGNETVVATFFTA
jgi:hypothetical protein